jgi:hypothetical protein
MIELASRSEPPAQQLFRLANGPFDPPSFRRKCEQFAAFDTAYSYDDLWRFSVDGLATLIVALKTEPTGKKMPNGLTEYRQLGVSGAIEV